MREATLILPDVSETATEELKRDLLRVFGGYTSQLVEGQWRDPADGKVYDDASTLYTIAMEPTEFHADNLRLIAKWAGQAADQITVYVRQASGEVEFVQCHPKPAEAIAEPAL